ncbi:MAG: PAS domain S-box protein [Bacteroidales bacterium]|jgi:PAS domain S-box-containing protein|nr:PAS domain S-box protein [Bacteroidales bacterium]
MEKDATIKELQARIAHLEEVLARRNHELSNEITELVIVKSDLEKRTKELSNRVQELKAVLQITTLSDTPNISTKDFYDGVLKIITESFQFPSITCAELKIGETVYHSPKFKETNWKMGRGIMDSCHEKVGSMTVYYLAKKPERDFGPFTKEERNLLVVVSRYLVQIIKRKQFEEQNRIFRAVLSQSPSAVIITNETGQIGFVNDAFLQTLGYTPEDMQDEFVYSIMHGSGNVAKYNELKNAIQAGEVWKGELEAIRKDGTEVCLRMVTFPVYFQGKIRNYVSIFNDITSIRASEKARQEQEAIYKTLVENIPLAITIFDENGKIAYTNANTEKMFQLENGSMTGKYVHEIFPKETADDQVRIFREIFQTGLAVNVDRHIDWRGQRMSFKITRQPLFNEQGEVRGVLAIAQNITQQTRHEQLLMIQHQIDSLSNVSTDLSSSLKMAFDNLLQIDWVSGGGVYLFDENKKNLNLVYTQGLSKEYTRMVSKYPYNSDPVSIILQKKPLYGAMGDFTESVRPYIQKENLKLIVSIPLIYQDEVIGCLNLGSKVTDEISPNDRMIIESIASRMAVLISLLQTREKLTVVNEELKKSLKEIRENQDLLIQKSKLESLGRLTAGLAHEINQPLSVIALAFENITYKLTDSSVHAEYLARKTETINQSIEKIRLLIDHFRLFARDQSSVMFEKTDVNIAIRESVALTELQMAKQHITVDLDLCKGPCFTLGNLTKLEQVMMNLISNARDAVEEKGRMKQYADMSKHIVIKSYVDNQKIIILVEDNGIGITTENQAKLFTPFFTTKPPGQGTGLGLAIVYAIVTEMKGSIKVFSESENFTKILLTFPKI